MRTFSENQELVALRREQIATNSARILAKKGYGRMTVKEVAGACNMPMGMLYHYIGSKEDILTLVLEQAYVIYRDFSRNTADALNTMNPKDALTKAIEDFYRLVDAHQDLTVTTYEEARAMTKETRKRLLDWDRYLINLFEKLLIAGCKSGDFKEHNTKLVAQNIVTSGAMWAVRRWYFRHVFTIDEYIKQMTEFILSSTTQGSQ